VRSKTFHVPDSSRGRCSCALSPSRAWAEADVARERGEAELGAHCVGHPIEELVLICVELSEAGSAAEMSGRRPVRRLSWKLEHEEVGELVEHSRRDKPAQAVVSDVDVDEAGEPCDGV
jgi:hypothetical protein